MGRPACPSDNTQAIDQDSFWSGDNTHWDEHRIGWAIAGGCAALTVLISLVSIWKHCRNYTNRAEQRQILRILYMPPVYAIISFFSFRYFRSFTYYSLIEVAYEAVTLSAFLLLLIEYVASTASDHAAENAIARKDKKPLIFPLCFLRYRPTKPYFMYTVKWSVLQYVVIRPAVSIAGIVCEYYNVLCDSGPYSVYYANVYLEAIDFVSITIALYGLFVFYGLTHAELQGRRPLAKFLAIKLIVMFTFYQSFVFDALEGRVIHATEYWSETNIADGLTALTICIEMVFFAIFMMWAYPWNVYIVKGERKTSIWRPLWDSINYADFVAEIFGSLKFYFDAMLGKPYTHSPRRLPGDNERRADFGQAFGIEGADSSYHGASSKSGTLHNRPRASYDEDISLAPYGAPYNSNPSPIPPTSQNPSVISLDRSNMHPDYSYDPYGVNRGLYGVNHV